MNRTLSFLLLIAAGSTVNLPLAALLLVVGLLAAV